MDRWNRYPVYKDSGVGWLGNMPAHWSLTKMWDITHAISGGTPARDNPLYWGGGIPWVSAKDMKRRDIDSSEDTVTKAALAETGLKLIQGTAILVVVRGMILAHTSQWRSRERR
jgi:type I restriction enzyme S subunit